MSTPPGVATDYLVDRARVAKLGDSFEHWQLHALAARVDHEAAQLAAEREKCERLEQLLHRCKVEVCGQWPGSRLSDDLEAFYSPQPAGKPAERCPECDGYRAVQYEDDPGLRACKRCSALAKGGV